MATEKRPEKHPPLPVILLANHLLDGDVIFHTGEGWSLDPAKALVAHDDATVILLDDAGKAALARSEVVDAYLVDVAVDENGSVIPRHFRERFKTLGPSVRRDLGKQAVFGTRKAT